MRACYSPACPHCIMKVPPFRVPCPPTLSSLIFPSLSLFYISPFFSLLFYPFILLILYLLCIIPPSPVAACLFSIDCPSVKCSSSSSQVFFPPQTIPLKPVIPALLVSLPPRFVCLRLPFCRKEINLKFAGGISIVGIFFFF